MVKFSSVFTRIALELLAADILGMTRAEYNSDLHRRRTLGLPFGLAKPHTQLSGSISRFPFTGKSRVHSLRPAPGTGCCQCHRDAVNDLVSPRLQFNPLDVKSVSASTSSRQVAVITGLVRCHCLTVLHCPQRLRPPLLIPNGSLGRKYLGCVAKTISLLLHLKILILLLLRGVEYKHDLLAPSKF
jgi:hypothetical protein